MRSNQYRCAAKCGSITEPEPLDRGPISEAPCGRHLRTGLRFAWGWLWGAGARGHLIILLPTSLQQGHIPRQSGIPDGGIPYLRCPDPTGNHIRKRKKARRSAPFEFESQKA